MTVYSEASKIKKKIQKITYPKKIHPVIQRSQLNDLSCLYERLDMALFLHIAVLDGRHLAFF
jgi:hypothetical protein